MACGEGGGGSGELFCVFDQEDEVECMKERGAEIPVQPTNQGETTNNRKILWNAVHS